MANYNYDYNFREGNSYGFRGDIAANLQSYVTCSHLEANLVSQVQNRNPNGQVCIGFSHLDVSTYGDTDSPNEPEVFSPSLDMSSALNLVALNRVWDFVTRSLDLFSAPGTQEDPSTVSQLETLNRSHKGDSDPPEEEETQSGALQLKYFDFLPLYQEYSLQTVGDKVHELKDLDVSELVVPQCFSGLKQTHRSDSPHSELEKPRSFPGLRSPVSPGSFEEFLSPPSPCGRLESADLTPPFKVTSLWHELEEVKASGLLRTLTSKEIGLQESMFELISSEASYLKSLGVVVNHFYVSEALKKTVSKTEHDILFSNIYQVMAASARFLKDLALRLEENVFISQVGDIVLEHSKDFHQCYVQYVTAMSYQESLVNLLMVQNQGFLYTMKKLESDPVCDRHTLKSFLVLPFQRITRIKLLLETILKGTKPHTDAASNLKKAIDAIHKMLTSCDEKVKKMKQIEELVYLEMQMDFSNIKSVPLVTSTRFLTHQGSMKLIRTSASRMLLSNIHLHLFNDLLIISSKKSRRFIVVDHALFPAHVTVQHLKTAALGLPPDSFLLHLSPSQTGLPTAMVLVAQTRSDKEVWMKALSK